MSVVGHHPLPTTRRVFIASLPVSRACHETRQAADYGSRPRHPPRRPAGRPARRTSPEPPTAPGGPGPSPGYGYTPWTRLRAFLWPMPASWPAVCRQDRTPYAGIRRNDRAATGRSGTFPSSPAVPEPWYPKFEQRGWLDKPMQPRQRGACIAGTKGRKRSDRLAMGSGQYERSHRQRSPGTAER